MNKKIMMKITGMHCSSCETIIKEELSELLGVSATAVKAETGIAELILDETKNNIADVLKAVEVAGYKAEVTSETIIDTKPDSPISINKRTTKSSNPLKVKLSTQTTAEGKVQAGDNGRAYFEGVIKNDKTAEFEIPENRPEIEQLVNELNKPTSIARLFELVSGPLTVGQPVQSATLGSTQANKDALVVASASDNQRVNLSLFGMHCSSCANIIERSLKKVPGVNNWGQVLCCAFFTT